MIRTQNGLNTLLIVLLLVLFFYIVYLQIAIKQSSNRNMCFENDSKETYLSSTKINGSLNPKANSKHIKTSRRNIFFDLGANNGDSIYNFFNLNSKAHGGSFKGQIPEEKINEKWIVYAIEGNSAFDIELNRMKNKITSMGHQVILMNGTVGWTYDGEITFYLDKANRQPNQLGSSVKENHVEVVLSNKQKEVHPCVDIARLLKQYNENDFVVLKMDIEGSEYDLLLHFIKENVLSLIDYIGIEYHPYLSPYANVNEFFSLLFKAKNINEFKWA